MQQDQVYCPMSQDEFEPDDRMSQGGDDEQNDRMSPDRTESRDVMESHTAYNDDDDGDDGDDDGFDGAILGALLQPRYNIEAYREEEEAEEEEGEDGECENHSESDHLNNESPTNKFMNKLLAAFIKHKGSYALMDEVLGMTRSTYDDKLPKSYKTVINHIIGNPKFSVYIKCPSVDCNRITHFEREMNSIPKDADCLNCLERFNPKTLLKNAQGKYVASMSLKDQIANLSKTTKPDDCPSDVRSPYVLRLIFAADGIPLSDSSNQSLNPLIAFIDNFSNTKQMNANFLIKTASIWGNNPDIDLIFQPLFDELKELRNGFKTHWSDCTKIEFFMFIGDAPYRAKVCNHLSHNGRQPCTRCTVSLNTDQTVPLIESTVIERNPLRPNSAVLAKTTNFALQNVRELRRANAAIDQENASNSSRPTRSIQHYNGFKGQSVLSKINNFPYIENCLVEYMHCVDLGLVRNLLNMWTEDRGTEYFLDKVKIDEMNARIAQLKPPSSFSRRMRKIEHKSYFKSAELHDMLFYTGLFLKCN